MEEYEKYFAAAIGKRMRRFRLIAERSQRDVADRIDVHLNTIHGLEHGESSPRLWTILQLCRLYGISITDVLKGIQEADYVDTDRG